MIDAGMLAAMRMAQADLMQDTCVVLRRTEGAADVYGMPTTSWTAGSPIACGVATHTRGEAMGRGEVPLADVVVRLPLTTAIGELDRVRITHRHGTELSTAETFEMAGPPERGPSALVCRLKRVTE